MKTPKDIVVYIDTADVSVCRVYIDYAVSLASAWDAHVVVAFVPEDLIATPSHGFARGQDAPQDAAVHGEHGDADRQVLPIGGEDAADDHEGQPAEHQA